MPEIKDIKDQKTLEKIRKAKEQVALKKNVTKKELTKEQQKNIDDFYKTLE